MTMITKLTTFGLLAALAGASVAPVLADQQSDKNNMRNLALGGAAVALYGVLNHNNAATIIGAAGAGLAGSQYEKDRKNQSQNNGRYYHYNNNGDNRYNDYNNGYNRDGYNRDGYNRDGYNRDGYNRDGYSRNGYNRDGYSRNGDNGSYNTDNRGWDDNRSNDRQNFSNGHKQHHGKGWYKKHQNEDNQNRDRD